MHETIFKNGFSDFAGALGNAVQCHELGLHVGRKARVLCGAKTLCLQAALRFHANKVRAHFNLRAGISEFFNDRIEVITPSVLQHNITASGRYCA